MLLRGRVVQEIHPSFGQEHLQCHCEVSGVLFQYCDLPCRLIGMIPVIHFQPYDDDPAAELVQNSLLL